jgi:zinc transport system substrate-binding protein
LKTPAAIISIMLIGLFFAQIGTAAEKITVFVSIVPQKYFVEKIGQGLVDVEVMVPPGANPHAYEPKPRQMAELSRAKLYFAIGIPFENVWLEKITAADPDMEIIHTDHGIEKIPMAAHHHHVEEAEQHETQTLHDGDEHTPGGLDPHIWLSPPLVKVQAHAILVALVQSDPVHRSVYEANYLKFAAEIDELDAELKTTFAGKDGMLFMVFHPAWGYFAHTYGLEEVPVEIEGKEPKPGQLRDLIEHAKQKDIRIIFVQPQFSARSADVIAKEIKGQVVFADPLAEDWMTNMRAVSDHLKDALK